MGYALTAFKESAIFQAETVPMIDHLETLVYNGRLIKEYIYYIMGQICIAKDHRGKGVFDMLYQHHKTVFQPQFELLVTEVSISNLRSLQAHKKLGFQMINTYRDALDEWDGTGIDIEYRIKNIECRSGLTFIRHSIFLIHYSFSLTQHHYQRMDYTWNEEQ